MTLGPIDLIALSFPGNKFSGEIFGNLQKLIDDHTIRVIDLVIVRKGDEGGLTVLDLKELDAGTLSVINPLKAEVTSLTTRDDIEQIGRMLDNGSTAAIMLFENLWAVEFKQAIINANGRMVMQERIPHEVVEESLEDLAALGAPVKA